MLNTPAWFKFRCPHCHMKHAVPHTVVGRVVRCEHCNNTVHVVDSSQRVPGLSASDRVTGMPPTPLLASEVTEQQRLEGFGYIFPPID
ncbi:MAG: hypothetical protein GC159_00990 [Phycisphaera sp.]|nr:hypothetical protein [Phycisphaera sp.]